MIFKFCFQKTDNLKTLFDEFVNSSSFTQKHYLSTNMAEETPTKIQTEYEPKEFFLMNIQDDHLVSWISDQSECLRSIFTFFQSDKQKTKAIMHVGDARIQIIRSDWDQFDVTSNDAVHSVKHKDVAQCLHLKDGTAVLFLCYGEGNLTGYHMCFEDAPDDLFYEMVASQK